jgi:hypothetical protein
MKMIPAQPGWRVVNVTTQTLTSTVADFASRDVIPWCDDGVGHCSRSPSAFEILATIASRLTRRADKSLIGSIESTAAWTTMGRAPSRSYLRPMRTTSRKNGPPLPLPASLRREDWLP